MDNTWPSEKIEKIAKIPRRPKRDFEDTLLGKAGNRYSSHAVEESPDFTGEDASETLGAAMLRKV